MTRANYWDSWGSKRLRDWEDGSYFAAQKEHRIAKSMSEGLLALTPIGASNSTTAWSKMLVRCLC
jgi:hypothetical protein